MYEMSESDLSSYWKTISPLLSKLNFRVYN
nr:MAG TPA: hypothetical protein [Crassvirales sp.]